MIKINKSLQPFDIPVSLRVPAPHNFEDGIVPEQSVTTHQRRLELIANGGFINENNYNSRYKLVDVKEALRSIYHCKCAFCEQKIEQYHVEHYRPKQRYWWLAYSWDNLLLACPYCNEHKGTNFDTAGEVADGTNLAIDNINCQSAAYDLMEQPVMVNPETTDPSSLIYFDKDGGIFSADNRFAYTIRICKISRKFLNDRRKKVLDDFRKGLEEELIIHSSLEQKKAAIAILTRKFLQESNDNENEFMAFRTHIKNHWLREVVMQVIR